MQKEKFMYYLIFKWMSSIGGPQKKYMAKNQRPSKVLLVCVYDTVVFEITHEIIRSKFEKFGNITKLLIFDKGEVTKFFIEYEEVEQAIQAKKSLDGLKLYETLCKMSIYFSNFSNVDIKHQQVDNSGLYSAEMKPVQQFQDFTKSTNREGDGYMDPFEEDPLMKVFGGYDSYFTPFHRSKTDNPRTLQDELLRFRQNQAPRHHRQQDELDHSIKKSIDCLLGPTSSFNQPKQKIQNQSKLKIKQESNTGSSVLCFSYKYKLKPHLIYNLFSNFGNLSCVVIKDEIIYIKFRSKEFAAIVSTYLNNTVLADNVIALRQCSEHSDSWKPTQNQYCEAVYYDSTYDRFTQQRSITINPPSNTIHVSSMKKQICREHTLRDIFEEYGDVDKVHILQQSNERNMALIKFVTLQDSFNAIANLHNENFSGRKMQISFTKSKI